MVTGNNALKQLRCRTGGSGFPLVLVHGYLGGGAQWQRQLKMPPSELRIIAPCLPGFGDSANIVPAQSIRENARLLLDFLAGRGINRFFLLGHSMGGMIAQEMTRQSPQSVAALILYGTGALGKIPGRFETMEESRRHVLAEGVQKTAARLSAKWLAAKENSPHYSLTVKIAGQAKLSGHLAGLTAMESWDGRAALADIACPALIVWGELDKSYNREQIDFLYEHICGAVLKTISGASHLAHLEFPERFDDITYGFLRKFQHSRQLQKHARSHR